MIIDDHFFRNDVPPNELAQNMQNLKEIANVSETSHLLSLARNGTICLGLLPQTRRTGPEIMSKNSGIDGDNGSHDVQAKFGQRVRMLRKARGWSQEELAARALLHPTYIGSIERGERNVSLVNLAKLSEAFEMTLRDLLSFSLHDQDKEGIQEKQIRELVAGNDRLAIAFFQTFCQKCETLKRFRALQALIPDQKE